MRYVSFEGGSSYHLKFLSRITQGHDTTTSAMTFTVYRLALNPEIQEHAYKEVRSLLGPDPDTPCTYNDLQEMKYLEMVIKEASKIYLAIRSFG